MALRPIQRILQHETEFSSTAMPVESPPRTQLATSPSRSLLQQIERRRADCEAAEAHRETPQRVLQWNNAFTAKLLRFVSKSKQWRPSKRNRPKSRRPSNRLLQRMTKVFIFVAAYAANVANAVAQQFPSTNAPHGGPSVEQDAHMNPPERSHSPSIPVNPKLHPYDGSRDLSLWLRQVNAAFEAYHTPADQHLRWLVLALRRQAMCYWFFEVEPHGQVTSTTQFLHLLVQRFQPYSQSYHLQQQLNALRMQHGGYLSYPDSFLEIATQQRHLAPEALLNIFLSGLTVEYRTACLTHQVSGLWKAQELCCAFHFASANTRLPP